MTSEEYTKLLQALLENKRELRDFDIMLVWGPELYEDLEKLKEDDVTT